jgi:hypothetical protein
MTARPRIPRDVLRYTALAASTQRIRATGPVTYRVKENDTFSRIARDLGTTEELLLEANPDVPRMLHGDRMILDLQVGQTLGCPCNVGAPVAADTPGWKWAPAAVSAIVDMFVNGKRVASPGLKLDPTLWMPLRSSMGQWWAVPRAGVTISTSTRTFAPGDPMNVAVTPSFAMLPGSQPRVAMKNKVGAGTGPLGSDCSTDDDCISGNCIATFCAPSLTACTTNAHWDGTSCACDAGYQWSKDWPRECIQVATTAPPAGGDPAYVCVQGGGTWDGSNCTYPPAACGPGTTDDGTGGCRAVTADECSAGETFDPSGAGGYRCFSCDGAGTTYNLAAHTCVCADGQQWSDTSKSCVAKVAGTPPAAVPPPAPKEPAKSTPKQEAATAPNRTALYVGVAAVTATGLAAAYFLTRKKKAKR